MIFSNRTNNGESPRRAADAEDDDPILREAAAWVVRRDRGLSARETLAFERWVAADTRHAEALARAEAGWSGLDFIPEGLAQEVLASAKPRPRLSLLVGVPLAAAAAVALVFWMGRMPPREADTAPLPAPAALVLLAEAAPAQHTLPDGSRLSLNQGTEIVEEFTESERRLRLLRGEAHFNVSKDPQRPFVVEAGGVEVRAVGTAFNVNLHLATLEVLVTEGVVELELSSQAALPREGGEGVEAGHRAAPTLTIGQHASVAFVSDSNDALEVEVPAVVITTLKPEAVARAIAWQEPLRRLRGTTLAELAEGLAQRTGQRVVFADTEMGELRLGGRFRVEDAEGFVSVVSTLLDVDIERAPSGELVVRKKVKEQGNGK